MIAGDADRAWRPSLWLRALGRMPPAAWPAGRSIRAAVSVGAPVLIAALAGHTAIGMWISMGTLLLAAGERSGAYSTRFRLILVTAPIAAGAYFLGLLTALPAPAVVTAMVLVGFAAGLLSGYSNALSVATMQAMLIAAIAIGVDASAPYWRAAALFLAGALIYAILLGVEALIDRRRPQRDALVAVLRALAELARSTSDGVSDLSAARARAMGALDAFDGITVASRVATEGRTAEYARAARISRAADQLAARLLAHDAVPGRAVATAARLDVCADALARRRELPPWTAENGTLVRLAMLESAIRGEAEAPVERQAAVRRHVRLPGPALLASAGRLALCTGLAYVAFYVLPVPRGYWIALTVALVMKPDLGSVFSRAVLRVVGTVAGVLIAVAVHPAMDDPIVASIVIAILAGGLPWAMARSYALQAVFLAPLIIVLVGMVAADASVVDMSVARITTTAIGGAIVILAGYLVWPAARHPRVAPAFEATLTALAAYARAVADAAPARTVGDDRRTAYRRLSDAHVNLQRTLSEPPPAGVEVWAWIPVVTAAERVADRITDASASLTPLEPSPRAAVLGAMAVDLAQLADRPSAMDATARGQAPSVHGDDDDDPTIRELADEIANLAPMLAR